MEIFPQIQGIHVSDGEFQFGFGEFVLNLNFKRNKFIYIWEIFEGFSNFRTTHLATLLPRLRLCYYDALLRLVEKRKPVSLLFVATCQGGMLFDAQKGEKPSMFLASDVIKRHFGAHTESQESSSLPVAKHFISLCLAKRRF